MLYDADWVARIATTVSDEPPAINLDLSGWEPQTVETLGIAPNTPLFCAINTPWEMGRRSSMIYKVAALSLEQGYTPLKTMGLLCNIENPFIDPGRANPERTAAGAINRFAALLGPIGLAIGRLKRSGPLLPADFELVFPPDPVLPIGVSIDVGDLAFHSSSGSFTFEGDAILVAPRYLVKWVLPAEGVGFLGGQSGAGKSFILISLAMALAAPGRNEFFGHAVKEQVGVAILAAEGGGGLKRRIQAARDHHEIPENLPIAFMTVVPDLSAPGVITAIIVELKKLNAKMRSNHGVRLGLVAIDTLAAAFSLKDENGTADGTQSIKHLKAIADATDATVLAVHHYGKSSEAGLRGTSAFRAGADL